MKTEGKHDFSVLLINTRFSQDDNELDFTIESINDDDDEVVDPLGASNSEFNIDPTVQSSDNEEEKEGEADEGLDQDFNKNFEIFLSELQQSIDEETDESSEEFPPTMSPSQYLIKECRVTCLKVEAALKDELEDEEDDDNDEIEILDDPACAQCGLSLLSMSTFTPGGGCSEAEVVASKEINLITLETASKEGWLFCLQTTNLTVYDKQNHMVSFEKADTVELFFSARIVSLVDETVTQEVDRVSPITCWDRRDLGKVVLFTSFEGNCVEYHLEKGSFSEGYTKIIRKSNIDPKLSAVFGSFGQFPGKTERKPSLTQIKKNKRLSLPFSKMYNT